MIFKVGSLVLLLDKQQPQPEGATQPRLAFDLYFTAVLPGDFLDNRQSQTTSAGRTAAGAIRPVEPLEDVRQIFGFYATATVPHLKDRFGLPLVLFLSGFHCNQARAGGKF